MKLRICPHCGETIPLDSGFHFDENLNLIHTACGKVVFSTTSARDGETTSYTRRTTRHGQNSLICPDRNYCPDRGIYPTQYNGTRRELNKFDIDT